MASIFAWNSAALAGFGARCRARNAGRAVELLKTEFYDRGVVCLHCGVNGNPCGASDSTGFAHSASSFTT
jgi:hypothetical protein